MSDNLHAAPPSKAALDALQQRIWAALDPSLLKSPYAEAWTADNPSYGFCSIAAEAAWFLLGGKQAGWTAHHVRDHDGSTHWWLEHRSGLRFDPTADQYYRVGNTPPYARGLMGVGGSFMGMRRDAESPWGNERRPGLRAQALLQRMGATGVEPSVRTVAVARPHMR